jgi:hypothetical protein
LRFSLLLRIGVSHPLLFSLSFSFNFVISSLAMSDVFNAGVAVPALVRYLTAYCISFYLLIRSYVLSNSLMEIAMSPAALWLVRP